METRCALPTITKLPPKAADRPIRLPLIDTLRDPTRPRRRYAKRGSVPRVRFFDDSPPPAPIPPAPTRDDLLDASRISRRIAGLAAALDDLPGQAKRLARWKARRDRAHASNLRFGRNTPMKPGLPPGLSRHDSRRPSADIHHIVKDLQYFAWEAWQSPDTS